MPVKLHPPIPFLDLLHIARLIDEEIAPESSLSSRTIPWPSLPQTDKWSKKRQRHGESVFIATGKFAILQKHIFLLIIFNLSRFIMKDLLPQSSVIIYFPFTQ